MTPRSAGESEGRLRLPQGLPFAERAVLPNGLRIITERLEHVGSVSLGLWLDVGLRDESPGCEGINHFLEHMVFKGTRSRSALQIAEAADSIGGQVNGYTDHEVMYLYARTVAEQVEAALDLLFDLLLNPACAADDIAREKEVVLQEIRHVEDAPEDWVHDLLLATAWPGHPLGRSVMGSREAVMALDRGHLLDHLAAVQSPGRIVVTAAGRLDHARIVDVVASLAGPLPPGRPPRPDVAPVLHAGSVRVRRSTGQVHFCLGTPGCGHRAPEQYVFAVLDLILGGGASSRLFQEIRENRGLAYHIGSYLQSFRSAGLFAVDAGAAPEEFDLVVDLIGREVARLRAEGPSPQELERARVQLQVALSLAAESSSFRMQHLALCELHWGRVLPFDEIIAGINAVSAEDVFGLAGRVFAPDGQALVAIGPF